jgi:hypothetical protein
VCKQKAGNEGGQRLRCRFFEQMILGDPAGRQPGTG